MSDKQDFKDCPFCSEEIRSKALKCRYCQSLLSDEVAIDKSGREIIKKPLWKQWWVWSHALLFLIIIIMAIGGQNKSQEVVVVDLKDITDIGAEEATDFIISVDESVDEEVIVEEVEEEVITENYKRPADLPVEIVRIEVEPPSYIYGRLNIVLENVGIESIDEVNLVALLFDEHGYPLSGREGIKRLTNDTNLHPGERVGERSYWMVDGEARKAKVEIEKIIYFDQEDWINRDIDKWIEEESGRY